MPYIRLHHAIAPLMGASHLLSHVAVHVENALSRIVRAGGWVLLVGSLMFLARAAEAQQFTVTSSSKLSFAENVGNATVTITCTLSIGSCRSVSWATKNGTATAGTDFTTTTGQRITTNRIAGGESVEVNIPITNDSNAEAAEHFFLTLTFFDGTTAVDHRITIEASDSAGASDVPFSVETDSFPEDVGTAMIEITYTGTSTTPVDLEWTTKDGTAKAGSDYTARGRNITSITPGRSYFALVEITNDSAQENAEIFYVVLNGVDHPITIEANDASTSVSPDSFAEDVGTAAITVTNTGSSAVALTYATKDGTAKAGTNYTAVATTTSSSVAANGTITVNVTITNVAATRDPDRHFFLTVNGFDHRITITDASPEPELTVSPGSSSSLAVNEGDGSIDFTVALAANPPIIADVTVRCWTEDNRLDQPQAGQDYTSVNETLTWIPSDFPTGTTSVARTCTIPIIDDMIDEGIERMPVRFGDATGGATIANTNRGCCELGIDLPITDNDNPHTVSVTATTSTIVETGTMIGVTVNMSAPIGRSHILVGYRLSGTATPGYGAMRTAGSNEDYIVSYTQKARPTCSSCLDEVVQGTKHGLGSSLMDGTGHILFVTGESSKTFFFHVHDDQLKELTETIVFELIQGTGSAQDTSTQDATLHASDTSVTLNLQSDETGILTLTAPTSTKEGETAMFQARLNLDETLPSGVFGSFDVTVGAAGDTAAGADFSGWPAPPTKTGVFIGNGVFDIDVPIETDMMPELDETLTLTVAEMGDPTRHTATASTILVDDGMPSIVTLTAGTPRGSEGGEVEFAVTYSPPGTPSNRSETFAVTVEPGTAEASDYGAPSMTSVTLVEGMPRSIMVPVMVDDLNELDETFDLVLTGQGSPGGTSATMRLHATIDSSGDVVVLRLRTPDGPVERLRIDEGGGPGEEGPVTATFEVELDLDGTPSGRSATLNVGVNEGTAKAGEDYAQPPATTLTVAEGGAPQTFAIEVLDDEDSESAEYFEIVLQGTSGTTAAYEFRTYIDDNDGPDPILREIGRHAVARTEALIENQPRLIPMLRDPGARASGFLLRANGERVQDADGGFQAETVWGEARLSRAADGHGEHEHLLTTLGAHVRMSERLHLGGMLQFDRTGTKPGGMVDSGEIRGSGWMAGPYFAFRDASNPLFFEGRLLYGRATSDVDALVIDGDDPRSASVDSERWLVQARVEGTYRFGGGATLIPLADISHARDEMGTFTASDDPAEMLDAQTISLSKLQIGAELEIPVATARGDLKFRPGLRYMVSDANSGAWAAEEEGRIGLRSRGRIDFGVDYRLEDGLVLGFESFYSGLGRNELESYGAGLDLRLDF